MKLLPLQLQCRRRPWSKHAALALPIAWLACVLFLAQGFAFAQKADDPAGKSEQPATSNSPPEKPSTEKPSDSADSPEPGSEASPDRSKSAPEEDLPLPSLEEMQVPTVEELHKQQLDWIIVLQKDAERVLVTKRVNPRPDTIAKMQAAIEESKKWPRPETDEEREDQKKKRNDLNYLTIFLPGEADENEYQIHLNSIRRIIYHEDLILRRAGLFMDEGKLRDAFELIFALERQLPNWSGLAESKNRLVFLEADAALARNDAETALTYLEELHGRDPKYPRLYAQLGVAADALISAAHSSEDFRGARFFLRRLEAREAKHEVAQKWHESMLSEARSELAKAAKAASNGAHDVAATAVDRAAFVWPETPGLPEAHRRYANRFQRVKVGVVRWAGEKTSYALSPPAEERQERLTQFRVFEVSHVDDATHYRTPLFEQWVPMDLGRQVVFTLRQSRALWESKPMITASTIASNLARRIDPGNPEFDERLYHFVDSIKVRSPFEFEIRFARVPVRTEPLFRFALTGEADASMSDGGVSSNSSGLKVLSRRFERQDRNDGTVAYDRVVPQPDGLAEYHAAEVVERRYESHERALQGLLRGEVSVLPELPAWDIARIRDDDRFFVLPYAVPTSHVLQFNPKSKPFSSREFRMAIDMSIDKQRLLNGIVLRELRSDANDLLVTAPYSRRNPAYNPLVGKRPFDLTVALALVLAAKKSLGGQIPPLKMLCTPDVVAEAACREMITQWKRIGIPVELVTEADGPAADWDILYRTVRMEDPMAELPSFLAMQEPPRVESLRHLPDWLRQELIDMENAGDWSTATSLMHDLHRHLYAEAYYVPLWELQDYLIVRKNIRGFPSRPVHPYQDMERWIVQSWYPTDKPGESGVRPGLTQK